MSTTPTAAAVPKPSYSSSASSSSMDYHQPVRDPLAHFKAIPWCTALLSDPRNVEVGVPDRRPLPDGDSSFVRKIMTGPTTVRACVTFVRMVKPPSSRSKSKSTNSTNSTTTTTSGSSSSSSNSGKEDPEAKAKAAEDAGGEEESPAILGGGGRENGEDPRNPFLLLHALADLGADLQSFPGIMHGGLYGVLLDEVMGTAANLQTAKGAFTVRFTTNFRRAIKTPQIVLIRGRVVRKEGRKIHVRGTIEDKDGKVMAEGDGLWLDRTVDSSKL